MRYYDIKNQVDTVGLYDAVVDCVTTCGGMYLPKTNLNIPKAFLNNMDGMSLSEIAYVISDLFLSPDIDSSSVKTIVEKAFNFELPLVRLADNRFVLELFHGPTMAFKDIGVSFMAEIMRFFRQQKSLPVKVVVSSTGNTASAVANACSSIDGVNVYILVPRSSAGDLAMPKWTPEMNNIHLFEVAGDIDDCKNMISAAFVDKSLRNKCILTSSNSVNISRIISQVALFFYAASRLKPEGVSPDNVPFSMPSGNLSMLTAGILSKLAGLRCGKLIAACNANNLFDIYLKGGQLLHKSVVHTQARYMDTALPLNMPRIEALYGHDLDAMRRDIQSATISDQMIIDTIVGYHNRYSYVMDPHTAVAMAAMDMLYGADKFGLVFATASPARSAQLLNSLSITTTEQNKAKERFDSKSWRRTIIPPTYPALRKALLE